MKYVGEEEMCDAVRWLRSVPRNKQSTHNGFHNSPMSHIAFSADQVAVAWCRSTYASSIVRMQIQNENVLWTNCRKPLDTNHFTLTFTKTFFLFAISVFRLFQFFSVDCELFKFCSGCEWLRVPRLLQQYSTKLNCSVCLSLSLSPPFDQLRCFRFGR